MSAARKRKHGGEIIGGVRQENAIGLQAKPGAPRKKAVKGGRASAERPRPARPGSAKKSAAAGQGTDRSRHKVRTKKKTRATSLSPSLG